MIDDSEKLRRWATSHSELEPPSIIILKTDLEPRTLIFSGWLLGRGAEGYSCDELDHELRRSDATIYLASDGRVLCVRLWLPLDAKGPTTQVMEYRSDLTLLKPLGESQREEADKCVRIAAREARKRCPVFGVFGGTWY